MANKVLLTYSVLDNVYENGKVQFVEGMEDANSSTPTVGTVVNPDDTGVTLATTDADPKMFSYVYNGGARMLLAKVTTTPGVIPSTCTWTLLTVPNPASGGWSTLAQDITLQYNGVNVATNPYGVAQVGEWLYIVDYDSQKIIQLGVDELKKPTTGSILTLEKAPYDLGPGTAAGLSPNAKGQAIIALSDGTTNYLYALYTVTNNPLVSQSAGVLVRMTVNGTTGALTYDTQVEVGANPQEIVPVTPDEGPTTLLIPAVGGIQKVGSTNGTASNITSVDAFATPWPATAPRLITGDRTPRPSPAYDIHAIAAPLRGGDEGVVYILTLEYGVGYNGTDWALYKTTVSNLLSKSQTPISSAGFTRVEGVVGDTAGYFWSILYENGTAAANDRLWFFRGSPLLVTPASAYLSPQPAPTLANKYFDTTDIGGMNVDWADLTSETLSQAAAGVSLKRGFRSVIKAPKAAEEEVGHREAVAYGVLLRKTPRG
jgi:hypothetical protein